jgi:Cupredoxin-like domain
MKPLAIFVLVAGLFALAACNPIDWPETTSSGPGQPICWECPPPPPPPVPTDTVHAGAWIGPEADPSPNSKFTFSPDTLTVKVGFTVTWYNGSPYPHSATSDAGVWDSGALAVGNGSYSITFNAPGTYRYHCSYHGEQGTIIVTP